MKNKTNFEKAVFLIILILTTSCLPSSKKPATANYDDFKFLELDVATIQQGYKNGDYTIKDVVSAHLQRIEMIDKNGPKLNSIITVNPDALQIAEVLDKELSQGQFRGPLHGIPVILKDNIDTHDKMATTAGSRALMNSYPLKDSYLVQQLRKAGAVIIAKANLSEWANFRGQMSTSGWSGVGGLTKNPYILPRTPCGSSSGSAVAVSANLAPLAIGTETNGSIVCPSHSSGIVGLKPTVGLISRSGVIPISFTQDTPGPMARTVKDVAICLGAMVGVDSSDTKTIASHGKYHTDYTQFLNIDGLKGKRIGLYKTPLGKNYKVDTLMYRALGLLKKEGVEIVEIEKIIKKNSNYNSFQMMLYEYKDGLNKYFQSLGPNAPIKNIDELIAFNKADSIELKYFNQKFLITAAKKGDLNSKEYKKLLALVLKTSREEGIDKVMNEHNLDAIIAPTGSPAWLTDLTNGDSFKMGSSSPAAHAGYPNITVPMGFIDGLPVGISFFGRAWSEPLLLEIAYAYENKTKHRQPPRFLDSK